MSESLPAKNGVMIRVISPKFRLRSLDKLDKFAVKKNFDVK